MFSRKRSMGAAASLTLALAVLAACGPGEGVAWRTVDGYMQAVQTEDLDALFCLSAGAAGEGLEGLEADAARSAFEAWARAEYDAYLSGRDRGGVDLDASAIVLVKAFTLGKGTFYNIDTVRSVGRDAAEVTMNVRFAYGDINIGGLKPDTTFYVCGVPAGRIHAIRIPRFPGREEREVLNSVVLRWTLVRQPAAAGCEERWTVNRVEVVPESVTTDRIEWLF